MKMIRLANVKRHDIGQKRERKIHALKTYAAKSKRKKKAEDLNKKQKFFYLIKKQK